LNLCLYIFDGVAALHLECDCLPGEGLHKYLHDSFAQLSANLLILFSLFYALISIFKAHSGAIRASKGRSTPVFKAGSLEEGEDAEQDLQFTLLFAQHTPQVGQFHLAGRISST